MKDIRGIVFLAAMIALPAALTLWTRRTARRNAGWDGLATAFPAEAAEGTFAKTASYAWTGRIFLRWSLKAAALPRGLYLGPTALGRLLYGLNRHVCVPWDQVKLDPELGARANLGYRLAFRLGPEAHPLILFGGAARTLSDVLKG